MSLFSERMGYKPVRTMLQVDSMDRELRNGLWNVLFRYALPSPKVIGEVSSSHVTSTLSRRLWRDYFREPFDLLGERWATLYNEIRGYFFSCEWFEVYDLLEFIADNHPDGTGNVIPRFIDACNNLLKREVSAYRFVGGKLVPITSEEEITEIEEALTAPDSLSPIRSHLNTALGLLADRKSPDYRNSIKESISAVEALSRLITGDSNATLGKTLKRINASVPLHGALQKAFGNLYGYSSDADGIRHSLMDESTLDFEDAKFMLVSCSAFVNYLIEKASKAGIEF